MRYVALCQDCLRVTVTPWRIVDGHVCLPCGGELCDCRGCLATIQLLEAGVRDAASLHMREDVAKWSAVDGIDAPFDVSRSR